MFYGVLLMHKRGTKPEWKLPGQLYSESFNKYLLKGLLYEIAKIGFSISSYSESFNKYLLKDSLYEMG